MNNLVVTWDPPEYVDLNEVTEVTEEMGYLSDKSGEDYIDHLREETAETFRNHTLPRQHRRVGSDVRQVD